MAEYVLTMTEKQARLIMAALDFYMRMRIGQWREVIDLCLPTKADDNYKQRKGEAKKTLLDARAIVMPDLPNDIYATYSVFSFPETRQAYNALLSIRSCIAWHEYPEGGIGVIFDRPLGDAPKCEVGGVDK